MSSKYFHGLSDTPTHQSWRALRQRCNEKTGKNAKYYASKGISYDPRWDSFLVFLEDMGERPEGTTLDRINSDGNYVKENCRWATNKQQSANRRSWTKSGEKYISTYKYGYRVKITGIIVKRVKTLDEAIKLRDLHLTLQEIKYV